MKKLLLLLWIVPLLGFGQGKTISFQKNMKIFNGQESSYFLNTSSTAQTKSGQLTLSDSLIMSQLATSNTTVATFTSIGKLDSLETVDGSEITWDTLTFDYGDVTNDLDVGDTIEFDNGFKIYNTHADTGYIEETVIKIIGSLDGFQSDGTTSLYYHELCISAFATSTGASGATLTAPTANTLGGYQLDVNTEQLYYTIDINSDWDGKTDIIFDIWWEVNEAASADGTVDLQLICYYKGDHEASTKSQTLEEAHTITGNKAQYTQHKTRFTINWDETDNVVQNNDVMSFILNLETDSSECDDIIVNHGKVKYPTTKPAPETN